MKKANSKTTNAKVINGVMSAINKKRQLQYNISVIPHFDLRQSREVQTTKAKEHNGWTLFINNSGTLCYGVHPTGIRIGPFTSPEYLKDVVVEHTINYFLNTIRQILP